MPLSPDEQRILAGIENGLRADDPAFAAKLTPDAADHYRREEMIAAHACLPLGMLMTLAGFVLLHQAPAAGGLLIFYGTGVLISALVTMLLRPRRRAARTIGRQGRQGGSG